MVYCASVCRALTVTSCSDINGRSHVVGDTRTLCAAGNGSSTVIRAGHAVDVACLSFEEVDITGWVSWGGEGEGEGEGEGREGGEGGGGGGEGRGRGGGRGGEGTH